MKKLRKRPAVAVEVSEPNFYDNLVQVYVRWRGVDGQEYGSAFSVLEQMAPAVEYYAEEIPETPEYAHEYLTDNDRQWLNHHMTIASA